MALFVILNIIIVIVTLLIDLYRHQFHSISFSSVLLAITLNSIFNQILLSKLTFISIFTMLMYCIWLLIQMLLDRYYQPFLIQNQKFFSSIVTIMMSISLVIIYQTGDQSYYMSVPYLAPAIFLLGCIALCSNMIGLPLLTNLYKKLKVRHTLWIGTMIIILSFIVITLLTPFWYVILVVNLLFLTNLLLEKIFILKKDD